MKPAFRLTKRYPVYFWATKLAFVKINKKISTVHQVGKHDNDKLEEEATNHRAEKRTHWQIQIIFTQRNQYLAQIFVDV